MGERRSFKGQLGSCLVSALALSAPGTYMQLYDVYNRTVQYSTIFVTSSLLLSLNLPIPTALIRLLSRSFLL